MPNIAISYRRSDSSALAGRIFDRLTTHYGKHAVFMDVDNIPVGVDFRAHIDETWRHTDILLAVIGANWLGARDGAQARMLEASDPVRVEIETALGRAMPIIPVLVDGAKMPGQSELPPEFGNFVFLNAADVAAGRDFHLQMDRLIAAIDRTSAVKRGETSGVYQRDAAQMRAQLARDAAQFLLAPLCLLLVAYYVAVLAFDLNLAYLWLACIVAPFGFGAGFAALRGRGAATAAAFAVTLGVVATIGMTVTESLATGDPLMPQTRFEWLDNFQFIAAIALSFFAGYFAAKALPSGWRRAR
jgi:TIR domain-containing protein